MKSFQITTVLVATVLHCFCTFQHCYAVKPELVHSSALRDNMRHATYTSSEFPLVLHVVTIPLEQLHMKLQLAQGQREETSSIARRTGAFIAVNGSNYRRGGRYNGNRLNLLYVNGTVYADLQFLRGSLGWNNHTKSATIAPVALKATLTINGVALPIDSINQPRTKNQSVVYNDVADVLLLNHTPGLTIIINRDMIVEDVSHNAPVSIPSGWHVYQTYDETVSVEKGMRAELHLKLQASPEEQSDSCDFMLGGAGLLIHNGHTVTDKLYDEFSQGAAVVHCHDEVAADFSTRQMQEWLIELRHPRTAVGITQDNDLCLVVVDGRQAASEGLNLHELAEFMQSLGCIHALNIGGGGCTTLYVDGVVINNPSANEERPVSEALCIYAQEGSV